MKQKIAAVTIVVSNYDEALDFYVEKLGFELVEDTQLTPDKRWVLVSPNGSAGTNLLLAEAADEGQRRSIGNRWDLVEYH